MQTHDPQRTPYLLPYPTPGDGRDFIAAPGWIGCPHCAWPIDINARTQASAADLATRVLAMMNDAVDATRIERALERIISDAHDTRQRDLDARELLWIAHEVSA